METPQINTLEELTAYAMSVKCINVISVMIHRNNSTIWIHSTKLDGNCHNVSNTHNNTLPLAEAAQFITFLARLKQ